MLQLLQTILIIVKTRAMTIQISTNSVKNFILNFFIFVKALIHTIKALIYIVKALIHTIKALVNIVKTLIHTIKALICVVKALVNIVKTLINFSSMTAQH